MACARVGGRVADAGLVQYGAIKCVRAAFINGDALLNVMGVQVVVLLAWIYTSTKSKAT